MKEIKKIGYASTAVVSAILGFIMLLVSALLIKLTFSLSPEAAIEAGLDASMVSVSYLVSAVVSGTFTFFIMGLLIAVFYNFIAKHLLGIRVEFADVEVKPMKMKKVSRKPVRKSKKK